MGWPRGDCQAGLLWSRGQGQWKLRHVQLRLRETAGTEVESSHWGRFRLRQSWLGLWRPRRWEHSASGRGLLGSMGRGGFPTPPAGGRHVAMAGGVGGGGCPFSAFEARITADHCCRFFLALEARPSSEACTCDIHDLAGKPATTLRHPHSLHQSGSGCGQPPRTLPNAPAPVRRWT